MHATAVAVISGGEALCASCYVTLSIILRHESQININRNKCHPSSTTNSRYIMLFNH